MKPKNKIRVSIDIEVPDDMSDWEGLSIYESVMNNIILAAKEYHSRSGFEMMMSRSDNKREQTMYDKAKEIYFAWADAISNAKVEWDWSDKEVLPHD